MIKDIKNLPTDVTVLHQIIRELLTEIGTLKEEIGLLKNKLYGKSSEKLSVVKAEAELYLEERELFDITADEKEAINFKVKNQPKRKKLPGNLARTDIIIEAPSACPSCGGKEFRKIEDDISETLEYAPSSFKVNRYIRPRCACIGCDQIVQGYPASKPIDKGSAGAGLLAHVLVQKYCDHLPLYRQSQIYEREGIELSRSTLASWVGQCAILLTPMIEELKKSIFSSSHLHGDDTPVKVLNPGTGKTKVGRLWAYLRDGRPHGDKKTPPAVCYFYSPDRKGERPVEHLKDFTGVLHADAYAGYNELYTISENRSIPITEAGCWAHTRRKFYEITLLSDNANIANAILVEISKIYVIEDEIRGKEPAKRLEHRQEKSQSIVENLFLMFKKARDNLPKKSRTAKAINYALNNEAALKRFLEDGKIEVDNNAGERTMKLVALGRKNWLFAGSDVGGDTAAAIYSLIETAKLNNLNPWKYLKKVLEVIQDYTFTKVADLLPWNIQLE